MSRFVRGSSSVWNVKTSYDERRSVSRRAGRVIALSDLHADREENWTWIMQNLAFQDRSDDVLILAGDISEKEDRFRKILSLVRPRFREMLVCFGNHDLWMNQKGSSSILNDDSLSKLLRLEGFCRQEDVKTDPLYMDGLWIVPLHSWHHSSFDREGPSSDWEAKIWMEGVSRPRPRDYDTCIWPGELGSLPDGDEGLAKYFDDMNDESWEDKRKASDHVITFSHFLSDPRLVPEKRMLTHPSLLQVVGSDYLGQRVRRLHPDIHVFGHSHFGWDTMLEGTRYVQPCLAYPRERSLRLRSLAISSAAADRSKMRKALLPRLSANARHPLPVGVPKPGWLPLPIYDFDNGPMKARVALWSNYYEQVERCSTNQELPPWNKLRANQIKKWVHRRYIRRKRDG